MQAAAGPGSAFTCAQCGGTLDLPVGARFAECPFCASSVYFDRGGTVLHFVAEPTLDEPTARARLLAWMAGNRTVKGLETQAVVGACAVDYFPLWRFVSTGDGGERQWCEPARASAALGIADVPVGGALRHVSAADRARLPLADPEVRLESALSWLAGRGVAREAVRETSLVHLPLFEFPYTWGGRAWRAAVDGVSGRILVGAYPAKSDAPYLAVTIAAAVGFFVLGMLSPNIFLRLVVFAVACLPFGAFAFAVARKV